MSFGKRLKSAMKQADMTPAELARALGCSTGTVADWRSNRCGIRLATLQRIATILDVPAESLVA